MQNWNTHTDRINAEGLTWEDYQRIAADFEAGVGEFSDDAPMAEAPAPGVTPPQHRAVPADDPRAHLLEGVADADAFRRYCQPIRKPPPEPPWYLVMDKPPVHGWRKVQHDNNVGKVYWYNSNTGVSRWDEPPEVAAAGPEPEPVVEETEDEKADKDPVFNALLRGEPLPPDPVIPIDYDNLDFDPFPDPGEGGAKDEEEEPPYEWLTPEPPPEPLPPRLTFIGLVLKTAHATPEDERGDDPWAGAPTTPGAVIELGFGEPVPDPPPPPPLGKMKEYRKFFRYLKDDMPKNVVAAKMLDAGLDPWVLDCDPEQPLPEKPAPKVDAEVAALTAALEGGGTEEELEARLRQVGLEGGGDAEEAEDFPLGVDVDVDEDSEGDICDETPEMLAEVDYTPYVFGNDSDTDPELAPLPKDVVYCDVAGAPWEREAFDDPPPPEGGQRVSAQPKEGGGFHIEGCTWEEALGQAVTRLRYEPCGEDTGAVFHLANGAKIRCFRDGAASGPASFSQVTEHGREPGHLFVVGLEEGTTLGQVPRPGPTWYY